ncbi:DUF1648 domain-containing protein [Actinomadura sp. ATCC 31491]|uniref:DUF1648 domain-containing protein n=1 Tax=Actinomadura luzonensis TaxID=2805427 RepID=A0ABT0G7R1_9ACTN|nr:DUF1648 domain-containing protein [Actinomadura luzonensis]MCK2220624.1 DUF1648 domain-containing protein [Actinomadura luzonensis]
MNPRVTAAAWGLLVTAVQIGLPLAVRGRLPEPMATHWGVGNRPDGSMPFTRYVLIETLFWVLPWVTALAVAGTGRALEHRQGRIAWWGGLFGLGVFAAGLNVSTVLANLGAAHWTQARLTAPHPLVVVAAACAAGALAAYLGRGEPDVLPAGHREPPLLRLRPGERAVWVGHVTNPWLALITLVAAGGLVVLGALSLVGVAGGQVAAAVLPALVIMLAVGLLTSSASVRAGGDHVVIRLGPLRVPVRRIPLAKIESAWAEDRYPSQVGGWGVRGLPGGATIMLRGGQCLVIAYRSGGRLAISVDDAARGASLVNALIAERVQS